MQKHKELNLRVDEARSGEEEHPFPLRALLIAGTAATAMLASMPVSAEIVAKFYYPGLARTSGGGGPSVPPPSPGAPNAAPVIASTVLKTTQRDKPVDIAATEMLAAVSDADGDALTISSLSPTAGSLTDNMNLTWSWTPPSGLLGNFDLNFAVTDGKASAAGIVRVSVILTTLAGNAFAWGADTFGMLGNGPLHDGMQRPYRLWGPTGEDDGLDFTTLAVASGADTASFACGIRGGTGAAYCWGNGSTGTLGDGNVAAHWSETPLPVSGGLSFSKISAGDSHVVALDTAGMAWTWGSSKTDYEGGTGDSIDYGLPTRVHGPTSLSDAVTYSDISTGNRHSCAIQSGTGAAYCWGYNGSGRTGTAVDTGSRSRPRQVSMPSGASSYVVFTRIEAGEGQTFAIEQGTGLVWAWGYNGDGRLGLGANRSNQLKPVRIDGPTGIADRLAFAKISARFKHACGITAAGDAYCWGLNPAGEIGDGTSSTVVERPVLVAGGRKWDDIATGRSFSCGVERGTGDAYCWGSWVATGGSTSPLPVLMTEADGTKFSRIFGGTQAVMALKR